MRPLAFLIAALLAFAAGVAALPGPIALAALFGLVGIGMAIAGVLQEEYLG